ncbi:MAG: ROK family transcriptional regulator [Solirubrobacterales bacterium]
MEASESGSLRSLRELNSRRVIDALRERGQVSRAEIARLTGLSRSTVSSIVADLVEAEMIREEADGTGVAQGDQGGRPPVLLSLNPAAGLALGVDFGHTHLRVAVSDMAHEVLAESRRELDVDHSAGEGLDAAAELVAGVLDEAGVDRDRVLGVGMGLPGPINQVTGTVGSSAILPGWVGVDAAAEISRRLDLPVQVENDANLGALAEFVWGSGQGHSELIYIKLSSGVGAGLLLGGRIYQGAGGTAGEIGHTVVQEGGAICRCGSRGCLETVASARAIAGMLSESRGEEISTRRLLELATEPDSPAARLIEEAGRQIGIAVANLCNLINPDRVIVGGELGVAGELLTEPILESIRRFAIRSAADQVTVVPGVLGDRAEMLGALALVLHGSDRFFSPLPEREEAAAA